MTRLKKKRRFNRQKAIFNLTTTAILGALGTVLMVVGNFMPYPIAPFLKLEPSDTVILVAYAICGFPSALLCAFIKALLDMAFSGLVGPFGIGQLTAILTSLVYVVGLYLCSHLLKFFKKGFFFRILSYVIIILLVTVTMTFLNYLFITPSYLLWKPATCFNPQFSGDYSNPMLPFSGSFLVINIALYAPFNLAKGAIVCALYELVFNHLIFSFLKNSSLYKRSNKSLAPTAGMEITLDAPDRGAYDSGVNTDFSKPLDFSAEFLTTTFQGDELRLYDFKLYEGPITLQALPYGGIQSVYQGKLIINTASGFVETNRVSYRDEEMPSTEFTSRYELVNQVLPN